MISPARLSAITSSDRSTLVLVVAIANFVALALLRVFAAELAVTSYLQSYLYGCALFGLAVGCLNHWLSKFKVKESAWFITFTIILALLEASHFSPLRDLGILRDSSTYFVNLDFLQNNFLHEVLMTAVLFASFALVVHLFVPLGFTIGRLSSTLAPGACYGLCLAGLIGGWLFYGALLALSAEPAVAVFLAGAGYLLVWGRKPWQWALVAAALGCALAYDTYVEPAIVMKAKASHAQLFKSVWVSEGHVQTYPYLSADGKVRGCAATVNHIPIFQLMDVRMSPQQSAEIAGRYAELKDYAGNYFAMPYLVVPNPERVLVLGAGTGNEVAQALLSGAGWVDAVESRTWLIRLSDAMPINALKSPHVRTIVMDPRQYLKSATEKYDLIVFGPMESTTQFSPLALTRTDNFVYATESFLDLRSHLKPRGYVAVSYPPLRNWYALRLAYNLKNAFRSVDAQLKTTYRGYLFAGPAQNQLLSALLLQSMGPAIVGNTEKLMAEAQEIPFTFDDWPFAFLVAPGFPRTYLYCLTIMMVAMLCFVRPLLVEDSAQPPSSRENGIQAPYLVRVLLVACSFMILSGKSIMTLAFNFGSTWDVALYAALAVFTAALLAHLLLARLPGVPGWLLWLLALLSLFGEYSFNYEAAVTIADPALRFCAMGLLPVVPVFFLGALLSRAFSRGQARAVPGFWFSGMVLGMWFQHAAFIFGVSALDVVCAVIVLLSLSLSLVSVGKMTTARVTGG